MKFRGSGRVPTGSGRFRGSKSGFQAKVPDIAVGV